MNIFNILFNAMYSYMCSDHIIWSPPTKRIYLVFLVLSLFVTSSPYSLKIQLPDYAWTPLILHFLYGQQCVLSKSLYPCNVSHDGVCHLGMSPTSQCGWQCVFCANIWTTNVKPGAWGTGYIYQYQSPSPTPP